MHSEPFKLKEVQAIPQRAPFERWNTLKAHHFNISQVPTEEVTFEMVVRGPSSWSQFQKAGFMVGDEAYAGARSYYTLEAAVRALFGVEAIVPTHNGVGAEKLLATVLVKPGGVVLHNRGADSPLVIAHGGECLDVTAGHDSATAGPKSFRGDLDLSALAALLERHGDRVAYVHVDLCPEGSGGRPVSIENLSRVRELTRARGVPLVIDLSDVSAVAWWNGRDATPKLDLVTAMAQLAGYGDILLMDASRAPRADVGGFVAALDPNLHEEIRSQVVVFEGLHTYGGMTGRAMEVFALGIEELAKPEMEDWHQTQLGVFHELLVAAGVPAVRGARGVMLDVTSFLGHLPPEEHPKFTLAAAVYLLAGARAPIEGSFARHLTAPAAAELVLELPRFAFTRDHLAQVATDIGALWQRREEIAGLKLVNEPEFVDEARFAPARERLLALDPRGECRPVEPSEPWKIAVFEPLKVTDKAYRREAMVEAGYNTFLLRSEDVYLDLLTDSGTTAMSSRQWEGMTATTDTPFANRHARELEDTVRSVLGFDHVIPTHQGRAAEHIMSQVMIRPGQLVPGNMYFTTTKLHQEMAGGVFVDIIVDDAHDPTSTFRFKGNLDCAKLQAEIERVGADNIAYISAECCVNLAGGQPLSMANLRDLATLCQRHEIPIMFDATRAVENAHFIKQEEPGYAHRTVRSILTEMMSYGDGCTISCKKDFLVNMGGILACNDAALATRFRRMLRVWEGELGNGGLDNKDIVALSRGLLESVEDDYIRARIDQTQILGQKLIRAGIPIVLPPGSHAIFLDARRFLPHIDQDEFPAQALAAAIYIETGVRTMERGNVSKGRCPKTGENYRPKLELVRCTISRRVYTNDHMDFVVEGLKRLYERRESISGLRFSHEPKVLRFFQGRFEPLMSWDL